ncbi:MAG: hypothetical protein ACPLXM_00715 [Bacteroidales bacterium]
MENNQYKQTIEETEEFLPDFDKINPITGVVPVAVQNILTNGNTGSLYQPKSH